MSRVKSTSAVLVVVISIIASGRMSSAQNAIEHGHWVSAWGAAVHTALRFPGDPPSLVLENQTIRMVVRPTFGGERLRIRLSNECGTSALTIGSAHIAVTNHGSAIVPESDHTLTFGGKPSVSIPPGAPMLSDPIDLKVAALTELSVSVYLPQKSPATTMHGLARHDTYVSGSGDFTAKTDIVSPTVAPSWYWLADVEVWAGGQAGAVVTLGDSITDGYGAKRGDYADWPDILAKRLNAEQKSTRMAVVNEGISGNRILHDGAGASALARFDRDVLAQPGITTLTMLEGVNDITFPNIKVPSPKSGDSIQERPFAGESVSAQDLIQGMQQIIERAHEHGIKVFGATILPFEGVNTYSVEGNGIRQSVNKWIRTGGAFDVVFDFDAAMRDPSHPSRLRDIYDCGDHVHPSAAGYKVMADMIDLSLFRNGNANSGGDR